MSAQPAIRSKTLLIADDDPFYQDIANAALTGAGYCVRQAQDGEKFLGELAAQRVDVALLDLTMPVMDGFHVLGHVRSNPATAHLPVIVVTGKEDRASIERAYAAGATSFLVKPLNWSLLPHHVDYVLRAAQTEANLRDAMRTADFLSRLKSSVMSVLAREFRRPLQLIRSNAQALRSDGSADRQQHAGEIASASDEIDRTLLKMLHFGTLLTDEVLLNEQKVSLRRLITNSLDASAGAALRCGVALVPDLAFEGDPQVICDPALVGQAIRSLIGNAVAFSPRGNQVIVRARIGASSEFSMTVEDSAPALPKDAIRRIFCAPEAIGSRLPNLPAGRDVGLSISRILAEAHQGTLGISAAAGDGNIAILALPPARIVRGNSPIISATGSVH